MTLQEIRTALTSVDAEVRRQAVADIEAMEGKEIGALLLAALGDEDWRVRKEAVNVARKQAVRLDILPDLVDAICQEENFGLRNAALELLEELGTRAAEVLLDALPQVPDYARKFVVEALACGGDERVIPALVNAANQGDSIVAAAALDALSAIGGTEAELALRAQLVSPDSFHRMAAIDGLNRLGAIVPWEELAPLLTDRLVRRVALAAIGRCGRVEAAEPLFQALSEKSTYVISAAVVGLAQLSSGPREVAQEVANRLSDLSQEIRRRLRFLLAKGSKDVQQSTAYVLCLARDRESIFDIVELSVSYGLSPSIMAGLQQWGQGAVRELLDVVSRIPDSRRPAAIELACEISRKLPSVDSELVSKIRSIMRASMVAKDEDVVIAAIRGLSEWSEARDAETLVKIAETSGEDIAIACGKTLLALAQREPAAVESAVRSAKLDGPAGASLVTLLVALGGPNRFQALEEALNAQDAATRKAALLGLAELDGSKVADLITFALADESVDVQMTAAAVLGRLRDEDGRAIGTDSLLLALTGESSGVRAAAAQALGETGDQRAIEPLRNLVRSTDQDVAVAAIKGLRKLGEVALDELLLEALGHEDEEVVKQALLSIAEIGGSRAISRISMGLEHAAWDVRQLAANLLGGLSDRAAADALRTRLDTEPDELVRVTIKQALSKHGEIT
ncbi:MAG: HEAT repeat domain-containing protein [Deltaproteobacteria bacterium]|nr:HEAT repeat domain-containing protein [Deltaproteobacteria bacterium]